MSVSIIDQSGISQIISKTLTLKRNEKQILFFGFTILETVVAY